MTFELDVEKAAANLKKHKVAFSEAVSIMFNPLTLTFPDPAHSIGENREISIGYTITGLLVFVSHTQRGEKIRVISARSATPAERKRYEKGISN